MMKPGPRLRNAGLLALLAALVGGCNTGGGTTQRMARLLPSPRSYERDVPIPTGFAIVDQLGESRSTGVRRLYLRHVYEGQANKYAVRNFYLEQMPLAGWIKVSEGNVGGLITMRYEKASESCAMQVTASSMGKTRVQVIIAQEERATSPPVGRDKK